MATEPTTYIGLLVELIAWHGEENEDDYSRRVERAEQAVRKLAPERLRAEKAKAKEVAEARSIKAAERFAREQAERLKEIDQNL